jgi:hypothetical protein
VDFQTPDHVCEYMVKLLPKNIVAVLEPTPGEGNLVKALRKHNYVVDEPVDFFTHKFTNYDAVVMNPPFTPMTVGYDILYQCMELSDCIIALMPWLTIINSQKRTNDIIDFGLCSITHLPRSVFKGARVQTCILKMVSGYDDDIIFTAFAGL